MARIAQINLRVRPSLKAKLEKLAKEDRRTLSAYVENLLEDHVTEQERRRAKQALKEPTRCGKFSEHDAIDAKSDRRGRRLCRMSQRRGSTFADFG
jgi:hypothetical protein